MTFTEARQAVNEIANGKYSCVQFEATTTSDGRAISGCRCYVEGLGWTAAHRKWELAIAELKGELPELPSISEQSEGIDEVANG